MTIWELKMLLKNFDQDEDVEGTYEYIDKDTGQVFDVTIEVEER